MREPFYRKAPVKAKSDAFFFSDDVRDWQPKVHLKRAEDAYRHRKKGKRTLLDVRSKRNHTKDLNNLI